MSDIERCRNRQLPEGSHQVALERTVVAPSVRYPGTLTRRFVFTNPQGEISRKIGVDPQIGTDAYKFVKSLFGHGIKPGDDIDYDLLIGKRYEIVVSNPKGRLFLITSLKPIADKRLS